MHAFTTKPKSKAPKKSTPNDSNIIHQDTATNFTDFKSVKLWLSLHG